MNVGHPVPEEFWEDDREAGEFEDAVGRAEPGGAQVVPTLYQ